MVSTFEVVFMFISPEIAMQMVALVNEGKSCYLVTQQYDVNLKGGYRRVT